MIRILAENVLLFLLPTLIYVAWIMLARGRAGGQASGGVSVLKALDNAPMLWLFGAGAILILATLFFFGTTEGGKPGQHYEPATIEDGKVKPSHFD